VLRFDKLLSNLSTSNSTKKTSLHRRKLDQTNWSHDRGFATLQDQNLDKATTGDLIQSKLHVKTVQCVRLKIKTTQQHRETLASFIVKNVLTLTFVTRLCLQPRPLTTPTTDNIGLHLRNHRAKSKIEKTLSYRTENASCFCAIICFTIANCNSVIAHSALGS